MDITLLAKKLEPFNSKDTINDVALRFQQSQYHDALSLPVVDDQKKLLGSISRYQLNEIFLRNYGRELYGNKPVSQFMKVDCLRLDSQMTLAESALYVAQHISTPLSEDFIICHEEYYLGVGGVLSLLAAMNDKNEKTMADLSVAYKRLTDSQAQLVQSEKMASLGQMVAGVAHEINTPLGYVSNNFLMVQEMLSPFHLLMMSFVNLIENLKAKSYEKNDILDQIEQLDVLLETYNLDDFFKDINVLLSDTEFGLSQIQELVKGLKDFSRLDKQSVDNIDIHSCIENSLLIAKNNLKNKVDVITQYNTVEKISCSPSQINQVFLNLINNSAQAISDTGKILIKTWQEGDFVFVSIQDNGKGMTPDVLKRIFDPFFTTKAVGEGTGLGLSIVWQIVQQHKGKIRVASQPDVGTRFVISLPIKESQVVAARLAS